MGCTVRELLARMELGEYLDWIAYYAAEPWGESRADQRLAVQLHYSLSPWMSEASAEPPSLAYPYFEDLAEAAAEVAAAQAEYRRLEDQWRAAVSRETAGGKVPI